MLIKLKDSGQIAGVTADINSFLSGREIDAEVSDWLSFAGIDAEMAYSIKNVFNILILIIAVVAVIIIMNTLVISVTERMPEIGTMRAIGAQKSFVRSIRRSIQTLESATRRIAQGDLNFELETKGSDDIALLTRSFEAMRLKLKEEYARRARDRKSVA